MADASEILPALEWTTLSRERNNPFWECQDTISLMPDNATKKFLSWARYLFWSEIMRRQWDRYMAEGEEQAEISEWLGVTACWAASLYVVVEAWESLKYADPIIDELLKREGWKDKLKRLRNGTFHYQPDLMALKQHQFLNSDTDVTLWLITVHEEFCRYFRGRLDRFHGGTAEQAKLRALVVHLVGWIPTEPHEREIEFLKKQMARVQAILASGDADHETRADLESSVTQCHSAIKQSMTLVFADRRELLLKLGVPSSLIK